MRASKPAKMCMVSCNVYISEGRSPKLIEKMREIACASSDVTLITSFVDEPYHRSSYTLAGMPHSVLSTAFDMCEQALQHVDLTQHDATHPRIGVVDHISFHPLEGLCSRACVYARCCYVGISQLCVLLLHMSDQVFVRRK